MILENFGRSLAIAASIGGVQAQRHDAAPPQRSSIGPDAFVAPIHTAADDTGVPYGVWASGPDYKVSFHDGAAFYPVLGAAAPENLPLRWAGTEVLVGDRPLAPTGRVEIDRSDWHIAFRVADGIVEAYDVRPDGVEQTFVLDRKLAFDGDLRIRGTIDSRLRAEPGTLRHAPISFHDARGASIVEYGAATVVDARGERLRIESRFVDGTIELVVPAPWLAQAVYPIVVDPLIGRVRVHSQVIVGGDVEDTDVAWDVTADAAMIVYSRVVSASDRDAFARVTDADFHNGVLVFSDVTANWSTPRICCAFVGDTRKWIVAMERAFPTPESRIRWHLHDSLSQTFSSSVAPLALPAGETDRYPDVGAARTVSSRHAGALIVFQADVTTTQQNTANSECFGVIVDTSAGGEGTASPRFTLGVNPVGAILDREFPAVNQSAGRNRDPWIVAFQQRHSANPNATWFIASARISHTGVSDQATAFALGNPDPTKNWERVRIAGNEGRYLATFIDRTGGFVVNPLSVAPRLIAHRFDWSINSASMHFVRRETIEDSPSDLIRNGDVAFDEVGRSHWAASYETNTSGQVLAVRLGARAGIAERVRVHDGRAGAGFASSVTLNATGSRFAIAYGTDETGWPLYADALAFPRAEVLPYGTSCGPGATAAAGDPNAGNEYFALRLSTATPSTAAAILIGLGPSATPLAALGMPGCVLNVDPGLVLTSEGVATDAVGGATYALPLPAPMHVDLYVQWAYLAPGLNALGLGATSGLEVQVR